MPQLLRLRFVSLGHPQARMDDLVLDFQGPDGRPVDSTLWLRNGGGKSSILNLFFAIVRPHKREFLGGKAEAKQRSLNDYILAGDRSVAAAEWQLDPAADSLGFEAERFITGVFYERRDGSGDLRPLYFSCRVADEHPESTLEKLPLYATSQGIPSRRTLGAFREAWRTLRDRAPHLGVGDTENQREWQEVLEGARIDPELFSYQVRMNQREGGADELFRFAEAEDFIDFLLALALDPALGDRVGRNISAFRRELLQRKEQLVPERTLVAGVFDHISVVRDIRGRRAQLRQRLSDTRDDLSSLDVLASDRFKQLGDEIDLAEADRAEHQSAAEQHGRKATDARACAALLKRQAAELRLKRLEEEHEQAQEDWRSGQRMARIWGAAVPLRRAMQFEEKAREQRRLLEHREIQHAPLRAQLGETARRFASALSWRARDRRREAGDARAAEKKARDEASECRQQAADAGKIQIRAETQATHLETRLVEVESRRTLLIRDNVLGPDEVPEAGLRRWTSKAQDHVDAVKRLETEITRIDVALEAIEGAVTGANDVLNERRSHWQTLTDRCELGTRDRTVIEGDVVLRAALELESIDADRLGADVGGTLDHAARGEQRIVLEERLAMADDQRAALHIEEHGLLPPSTDAQRVIEFLGTRLAGQAWSGWSWLQANVPKPAVRDAVRKSPSLAQGVVVRSSDFRRACELLRESAIETEGPLLIADTDSLSRSPGLPGEVLGPRESAWFDREAARARLGELQNRLEQCGERIQLAEGRLRELLHSREAFQAFRTRYAIGWFGRIEREIQEAAQKEEEARARLTALQDDRKQKTLERRGLEKGLRSQTDELRATRQVEQRLNAFVEDHVRPSTAWRTELSAARDQAKRAAEDVGQWEVMAGAADARAGVASSDAQQHGEEARVLEGESSSIEYIDGSVVAEPGPLDELRDRYRLLCSQYEERVGAQALAALAKQNEENAREERARLAKLLSAEMTEDIVREHMTDLAEPDTVEQLRQEAEAKASSLQGKMGNLKGRIDPAKQALEQAEEQCKILLAVGPLKRAPSTPELAESEASSLENEATLSRHAAESEQTKANDARQRAASAQQLRAEVRPQIERLRSLRDDYEDLLAAAVGAASSSVPATLEASLLPDHLKRLGEGLKRARGEWQGIDSERGAAITALRAYIAEPVFERIDTPWLRRIQEHDEPALEDASDHLVSQLDLRRTVLEAQIADVDRHRAILVDELQAVAEEGLNLLRQASSLSRLPDHVPGIGGAHFLRITTQVPDDPSERRARLAELIDELVDGRHDLSGVSLVQAAVRRLARPVQVRVLHPDPALDRRTVSIPEMARSSGGEQLTGAILLYCTLARVRGRARGLSRRASSVLILDNPIGRASRVRFLELQREVARAMGVQLIYTTGVNDHEALRALPNVIRLRNERIDRNSGRRLVEHTSDESHVIEAVRVGRRDGAIQAAASEDA